MGKLNKFILLVWKNWVLLKRKPFQTAFEVVFPVLFGLVLVGIRSVIEPTQEAATITTEFGTEDFFFYSYYGTAYSPQNQLTTRIMENLNESMNITNTFIQGFENAAFMEKNITERKDIFAGIEFSDDFTEFQEEISVSIRFHSEQFRVDGSSDVFDWLTNLLYPIFQFPGPRDPSINEGSEPDYNNKGFLNYQKHLTWAIIKAKSPNTSEPPDVVMRRFPYPSYHSDPYYNTAMETAVSLIMMICFMYNFINTVRAITSEKEKQLKESMKVMGLPGWLHWLAWFLRTFIIMLFVAIFLTVVLKVNFRYTAVFTKSDGSLLFVFLLLFGCATITFSFMVSVFFSKANTAAAVGGIFYFVAYLPYALQQQNYDTLTLSTKLSSCLLTNSALSFALGLAIKYEAVEEGVQWSNFFQPVTPDDQLTFGAIMLMMILDAFIYLLIALYVEAIFPGDFGVPQVWYFPVTASYWCDQKHSMNTYDSSDEKQNLGANFEESPDNLEAGVQIKSLHKVFGANAAVNNLNLDMFKGHITVLLGHNGAGKTTTMSMLTGMFPPTAGTALVNGFDIRTNTQAVRDSMGICLQHNVLFDSLTVYEHLYFFGKLKGLQSDEIETEIDNYIKLLELEDKRHALSSTLSGGMKRKLSVGMALCGRSQVVMLDEPTAGMDPSARRAIWGLLQKQKQDRSILLTTHFMDEADLLGDRIAIMAGGKLQCCGSSFFLKKRYGAGYYLIMDISPRCVPEAVTKLLQKHIPKIRMESRIGSELTYLLAENESYKFEEMLGDLEKNINHLGVESYGVSLTTLEEVFMKVGADHEEEQNGNGNTNITIEKVGLEHLKTTLLSGPLLMKNQFVAMAMKKILAIIRSWFLFVLQIALPIIFLIIAVVSSKNYAQKTTFPALKIQLQSYQSPVTVIQKDPLSEDSLYQSYKQILSDFRTSEETSISSAILDLTEKNPSLVKRSYIAGAQFENDKIVAWFNGDPYHSTPLSLSLVLNAISKSAANQIVNIVNKPLPLSTAAKLNNLDFNIAGYQIALNLGFGMAFCASFYIIFCIRERVCKAKHLQFVSGMNVFIFWGTSYLIDLISFLIVMIGILITTVALQEDGFKTAAEIGREALILFYFGCSVIPFIYVVSFIFGVPSTGLARVTLIGTVAGIAGITVMQVLEIPGLKLAYIATPLHWVLLFVPFYSMSKAMMDMSSLYMRLDLCGQIEEFLSPDQACLAQPMCCDLSDNYFAMSPPGMGGNMTISFTTAIVFAALVIVIEFGLFSRLKNSIVSYNSTPEGNQILEADVQAENNKVHKLTEEDFRRDYILVLRDMTKYYKNFLAVNGLCLAVKPGECFGLLGVNGAGKTSTFKMMTGDEQISFGEAFVGGLNITSKQKSVQKLIGYCPQFDALLDDLTARETLIIFGLIRGVPRDECVTLAVNLAHEFDFYKHLDKKVKELSGGNKRKLSTAIALIGDPPVIYLDEPTTGMDPATKRYLWKALSKLRDHGKCIVLTSHSMEECEALCTRIAIMVNGSFQCLGSTQRLKSKFAQGYALTIKVRKMEKEHDLDAEVAAIENFVQRQFPGAVLQEKHKELLSYQLLDTSIPWSRIFGILEKSKKQLNIEDYSVGQCSLEQVFLSFTKHQREIY